MSYQQVPLELARDGQCTPWGFRMTGGADIGSPLVIQKVIFGSPSEGELQKGDILMSIRDQDASRLSHKKATELITKSGSTLKLLVARNISGYPPGSISPVPSQLLSTMPLGGNPYIYKALPTTNFSAQRQRRSSGESFTSTNSSEAEKEAIINQPYRSTPLILPGAKVTKDIPVGSYLRFDPLSRSNTSSPSSGFGDPYMVTKVQHAIIEAAQTSSGASSPGRTPTPDFMNQNGPPMYLRQYNSPINMYSNQAIVEALAAQTVGQRRPELCNAEVLENKRLTNITQSPTYQLIHDEELRKGNVQEHGPLEEHVYNVSPRHGGDGYLPEIHQSGTMKSIMHNFNKMSDM